MAVGVLLFSDKKLLLVKPSYRDEWSLPGGVVEENESLLEACKREAKEEIGIDIKIKKMLSLDYTSEKDERSESLQFIFSGEELTSMQIKKIKIDGEEIVEYRFVNSNDALLMLQERLRKRVGYSLEALKNKTAYYLENGQRLF